MNDAVAAATAAATMTGVCRTAVDSLHAKTSETVNPLVQVGYRIRTKCLQDILNRFFSFSSSSSSSSNCQTKNLIVIGAGLDQSIGIQTVLTTHHVTVVEIDLAAICRAKRTSLLGSSADWIQTTAQNDGCYGIFPATQSTYRLLSADLNHPEQWQSQLMDLLQPQAETLVISELVLAYLSSVDVLLKVFAENKWHFVAYEPLGPKHNDDDDDDDRLDNNDSVLQSYRAAYLYRFREQLQKGGSSNTTRRTPFVVRMEPLGTSLHNVRNRLKAAGFQYSQAQFPKAHHMIVRDELANLNSMASFFDEHAALALHLRSYVVSISSSNMLLYHQLCGDRPVELLTTTTNGTTTTVWLCTAINNDDDDAIRTAFRETYLPFFQPYPAIRKLTDTIERESFRFNIGGWYQQRDGAFWILVAGNDQPTVIGGLGLRKLEGREATKRNLTNPTCCFEMERVFVLPNFRGRGLSKVLLNTAMKFAGAQSTIVATTLSVLKEANQLYSKSGFALTATETKGTLTYCTYTRYPTDDSKQSNKQ